MTKIEITKKDLKILNTFHEKVLTAMADTAGSLQDSTLPFGIAIDIMKSMLVDISEIADKTAKDIMSLSPAEVKTAIAEEMAKTVAEEIGLTPKKETVKDN